MISDNLTQSLNEQICMEANASNKYLAMAIWADDAGFEGVSGFFYNQADEERVHMLKLVRFVNERGGRAIIPALEAPKAEYTDLQELFSTFLASEEAVTENINKIVFQCLEEKNYTVHNFMQWFVAEQAEEEALARTILDKFKIIGNDTGGLYLFDRDINSIVAQTEAGTAE